MENNVKIRDKLHDIEIVDEYNPIKYITPIIENDVPNAILVRDKNGDIIGIITDSDIIMKVRRKDMNSETIKAKDIMTSPVVSIDADKSIKDAIDLMVKKNIQKLLVTEKGKPIGVIYGEEILEYDEEKWKEILFNQTVDEVYKLLLQDPERDFNAVYHKIVAMDKFANIDSKVEFDLYLYQEGIVLVAYNYIKENFDKPFEQLKKELKENYFGLLEKYSQ